MKVIIMSGISGSGKNTYIDNNYHTDYNQALVSSADDFFMKDGKYQFDHSKLNEAHGYCLRMFIQSIHRVMNDYEDMLQEKEEKSMMRFGTYVTDELIESSVCYVVVNNTNTTAIEIAPYFAIASAYGAEIEIVTLLVDPAVAAARNVHGVPLETCIAMDKRLRSRGLPKFWNYKNTVIDQQGNEV